MPAFAQVAQYAHTGYTDSNPLYGFQAVKATIAVVPVAIADGHIAVYCGIDDGIQLMWVQVGWGRESGQTISPPYYEYQSETGAWSTPIELGTSTAPSSASYEIVRAGSYLLIYVNGSVQRTLNWSDFDARKMCKAAYVGETYGAGCNHIGSPTSHCEISNISTQTLGVGYYESALLASSRNTVCCGDRGKSGSSFSFWDKRLINVTTCP